MTATLIFIGVSQKPTLFFFNQGMLADRPQTSIVLYFHILHRKRNIQELCGHN